LDLKRKNFIAGFLYQILSVILVGQTVQAQTTYYSRTSGNWNVAGTWSTSACGGAAAASSPGVADYSVICSGHTVTLNGNATVYDFIVNTNGTLDNTGSVMTVTGDLLLNGSNTGGGRLQIDGINTNIDGLGFTSSTVRVDIRKGNKTVLSTANITFGRDLTILTGITVTNYGTVTISRNLKGQAASSTWVNESNSRLNAGREVLNTGILTASATGNTVNYNRAGLQNIKLPTSSTYYHLEIQGNEIKSLTGNTIVLGDLIITSTLDVTRNNWSLNAGGNWDNSGVFAEQLGTVTFDGSGVQSITNTFGEAFHNLTVNKSGGTLTVNNDVTVTTTLTFTAGIIEASAGTLTLGDNCGNEGILSYTKGQIIGSFERFINTTAPTSFLFPVGTSSDYLPANVTFNVLSSCGSLIAEFIASNPGSNGLPLGEAPLSPPDSVRNTFVEGYWTLTAANGLGSTDYDLYLEGNGFTSFTFNPTTHLLTRASAGSAWTLNGAHSAAAGDTTHRTNITLLSAQYAFGDTSNCTGPTTSPISGPDSVCTDDTGVGYSVTNTPGSTYNWTVTGGSVVSPNSLNNVTIDWGSTGMAGTVQVVENNGCTDGALVNAAVNIHTIPLASITGNDAVAENTNSISYTITPRPGYTYSWTITGGTLIFGQGTDSILVNWGAQSNGNVRVVASIGCGDAPPVDLPITIYTSINSIASGVWTNPSTWDCNCVPANTDNVIIADPHIVSLTVNTTINNFTINGPSGQLDAGGSRMFISGDLTVDGSYIGTNRFELNGTRGVILSGTGTIDNTNNFEFNGGNVTIASGTNLSKTAGDFLIRKALTITNNGIFTIANNLNSNVTTSNWVNEANSTLNIGGAISVNVTLAAFAPGNTVNYNGSGVQTIRCPNSGQYYHQRHWNAMLI